MLKKIFLLVTATLLTISAFSQGKAVCQHDYLIKAGEAAPDFAINEAGVIRDVIIDQDGEIMFLTRIYEQDEFERMKEVIFTGLPEKLKMTYFIQFIVPWSVFSR
jgi:hypothetical protein